MTADKIAPREPIEKLLEVLDFYKSPDNFSITVWADETRDGECWLEDAKDNNLVEHSPDGVSADFGILAEETANLLRAELGRQS